MVPEIKARRSRVQLKRNRCIPLNVAYIDVCGLDHGVIRKSRTVVLSIYLDNGDDLNASPRLGVCAGDIVGVEVLGLSR